MKSLLNKNVDTKTKKAILNIANNKCEFCRQEAPKDNGDYEEI